MEENYSKQNVPVQVEPEKKIYQNWLFWLLVVLVIVALISRPSGGSKKDVTLPTATPVETIIPSDKAELKPEETVSLADIFTKPKAEAKKQPNQIDDRFKIVKKGKIEKGKPLSYIKGSVKNTSKETFVYVQITYNLYDKSGARIGTALDNINNLEGGATWKFKAAVFQGAEVHSCKLAGIYVY